MATDTRPGSGRVLGAHWDGQGTNFAVFSTAGAYGGFVELCLVAGADTRSPGGSQGTGGDGEERIAMSVGQDIWHVYVPGVGPGQRYGYRASGPLEPDRGLRFDHDRMLSDPYALALEPMGSGRPREVHSLVVDERFDWGEDRPPDVPWSKTVLYETHVQGISALHPSVPAELRGTYAGVASEPIVEHLTKLGVTSVELLPVHHFLTEQRLLDMGLKNYWGYTTLGFLAPHGPYRSPGAAAGAQVDEFKAMVKALHAAGLEVILDVVYNHTCEGGPGGPAVCFRGLANEVYYRLAPGDPSRYVDTTGTSNTLNVDRPEVLRLIMDSLRYWVTEMHVDGFRFDLAATLARDSGSFDRMAAFFDLVYQDPVVGAVKLIAEPWDIGAYEVGRFPRGWAEWNDRFRDDVRDFWRRRTGIQRMGYRLTGSSDLYGADRRGPDASVNFVTAHDGKTLADLVTYERKHNEANGESNRDGTGDDRGQNLGVEGPTDDPRITAARERQRRNFVATLMLSQGVPMLLGGDERGRTQRGNNNAYCQANEISFYDWTPNRAATVFESFTALAISLAVGHATLRRTAFFDGGGEPPDIGWYDAQGMPMTGVGWNDPQNHFISYLLAGDQADEPDDDVLVVINASLERVAFTVPGIDGQRYTLLLDTGLDDGRPPPETRFAQGNAIDVAPQTVLLARAAAVTEHAIEIDRYGGPEELAWRAVQRPALGAGEVRIRTLFAAVNRADIEICRGAWPVMRDDPFPYTPGLEVVGEVESVGGDVTSVAAGDRVITMMQHLGGIWGERPGGYGEFVVVDAGTVATIDADVDLEQLAALGLVAVTAAEGLQRLGIAAAAPVAAGTRVVVHGASGGVGSAAVTMAAATGCEVVAVLPRAGRDDFVRGLGAATVVCLDETSLLDALGARSVDAVLETTGERTFADSVAVLRCGGRLCLVGALTGANLALSAWDLIQDLELTGWSSENLTGDGLRAHVARIAGLVRDGHLRAPAIHRFALADAAAAHAAMQRGEIAGRALLCA